MFGKTPMDVPKNVKIVEEMVNKETTESTSTVVTETPVEEPQTLTLGSVVAALPDGVIKETLNDMAAKGAVILTPEQLEAVISAAAAKGPTTPPKSSKFTTGLKIAGSAVAVGAAVVGGWYLYKYLSVVTPIAAAGAPEAAAGAFPELTIPVLVNVA